jgi:hypothetical protein
MTPDERALLTRFLSDLAQTPAGAKDAEAASLIDQALRAKPDAGYLLVQHALLADQALQAAQTRIAELETQARAPAPQGQPAGFLGGGYASPPPRYGQTAVPPSPPSPGFFGGGAPAQPGGFGSFLRGAGTMAAGVAGGEFLFEGLSNLFGGGHRGGGFFGGGYGPTVEDVTINNYGGGDYDQGVYDDGGGWSDDGSNGGDF